ncbi:MAG: hypothetical protein WBB72_06455 [Methyloceanibacter sp.]
MRRFLWIVLFALSAAAALPAAAGAQHLTIDDVRNMALARGVATIKEIELDPVSGRSKAAMLAALRSR